MRRTITATVLAVAAAAVVAAPAAAGTKRHSGTIAAGGTVKFKLEKKEGVKKVRGFRFDAVPITCAEGTGTAEGKITFPVKLDGKRFKVLAGSSLGGQAKVKGKVSRSGSEGTLRITGTVVLDDDSTGTECDTGKLSWTATT